MRMKATADRGTNPAIITGSERRQFNPWRKKCKTANPKGYRDQSLLAIAIEPDFLDGQPFAATETHPVVLGFRNAELSRGLPRGL